MFVAHNYARHLGKQPARHDPHRLMLHKYQARTGWGPVPDQVDWGAKVVSPGACLNDKLGNCTVAAMVHGIQAVSLYAQGAQFNVPDEDNLAFYKAVSGYDGTPATDNGADEHTVLRKMQSEGLSGYKILGWCDGQPEDHDELRQGMALFGPAYVGFMMPLAWQGKKVWDVGSGRAYKKGSWGGHALEIMRAGRDEEDPDSWGETDIVITRKAIEAYCDELHFTLWEKWFTQSGVSPSNLNLEQLKADMAELA